MEFSDSVSAVLFISILFLLLHNSPDNSDFEESNENIWFVLKVQFDAQFTAIVFEIWTHFQENLQYYY